MKPEMDRLYSSFFSIMLLSMLIWGEGRGEIDLGKQAIAWVVRNRTYATRSYGGGWDGVMLKRKQFSCFNKKDINRDKIGEIMFNTKDWSDFRSCFNIAFQVYFGIGEDISKGATHYFVKGLKPIWRLKMIKTAEIGSHIFWKYPDE